MILNISKVELKEALKQLEIAEKNGWNSCQIYFELNKCESDAKNNIAKFHHLSSRIKTNKEMRDYGCITVYKDPVEYYLNDKGNE